MTDAGQLAETLTRVLAVREEVLDAYLFGSWASARAQPHSDIDVAVYVDPARTPDTPFGYPAELTTALMGAHGVNCVDVVVLNYAPPLLSHRVLRDGVRLVSRDGRATTTREGDALSRYCDYVPQLAKIDAAHRARMARPESMR